MRNNLSNRVRRAALILWLPSFVFIGTIVYSRMNSDIGYQPAQPIEFSHKVHVKDYEMKCMFCHHEAESETFSAVPTTFSCMVCHVALKAESEKVKPLIDSYDNEKPIIWTRIYKLPEYTKFNHNTHLMADIDCASCHGEVENMERVYKVRDFTMSWCMDCHRDAEKYIIRGREVTGIFNEPENKRKERGTIKAKTSPAYGAYNTGNVVRKYGIGRTKKAGRGPEECSACHY